MKSLRTILLLGALGATAAVTAVSVIVGRRKLRARLAAPVIAGVTINKPPHQVYAFFRRLEQLPLVMDYLESVVETDARHSVWTARLPAGRTARWEAEIVEDRPAEVLAWRSIPGGRIQTTGRVTFARAPGRDMTEVRVEMRVGVLGRGPSRALAHLLAGPQVRGDLHRLKQVLETGEVLYSDATAHRGRHPAQPSETIDAVPSVFVEAPITARKGATP
jgi:uncharacterized membrane protein